MARQRAMSWRNFERIYGVIDSPDGGPMFQLYERNLLVVYANNQVWSLVDGDNGEWYVIPGWHVVNMNGYIVTKRPWGSEEMEDLTVKW